MKIEEPDELRMNIYKPKVVNVDMKRLLHLQKNSSVSKNNESDRNRAILHRRRAMAGKGGGEPRHEKQTWSSINTHRQGARDNDTSTIDQTFIAEGIRGTVK